MMPSRIGLLGAVLVASLTCAAAPAAAQEHDYTETIREALSEFELGHFEESLALFRLAHSLRPSARTLRGLGNASFELRHYVDAVTHYRDALASTENPLTDEQRTQVEHLLARARVFLGGYRFALTPTEATVTIGSTTLTRSEVLLDIGEHVATVSAPGYTTRTVTMTVRGGEDETLTIALEPATGGAAAVSTTGGGDAILQGVVTPPAPATPAAAEVHIRVEARSPDLVLHAVRDGSGQMDFSPVCAAPCEATLAGGTYAFGISVGAGEPHPAGFGRIRLDHDTTLGLTFESRDGLRVAGGVTFGVGLAVGLALIIAGVAIGENELIVILPVSGALVLSVAAIVALFLAISEDDVSVRELGSGVHF